MTSARGHYPPLAPAVERTAGVLLLLLLIAVSWLAFDPHPPPRIDTGWDKLNHALAFAALAATARVAADRLRRPVTAVAAGLLGYGGLVELVQSSIPGRAGEWPDLVADAAGIAIGLAAATALLVPLLRRNR